MSDAATDTSWFGETSISSICSGAHHAEVTVEARADTRCP